jgi:putative transposase
MATPTRTPSLPDLTNEPWAVLQPLRPRATPGGRPRKVAMREVLNTRLSRHRTGCPWDLLPHARLPKSTVSEDFAPWRNAGTWQRLTDARRAAVRPPQAPAHAPPQGRQHRPPIGEDDGTGRRTRLGGREATHGPHTP